MKKNRKSRQEQPETGITVSEKKKLPGWMILPILAGIGVIGVVLAQFSSGGEKAAELPVTSVKKEDVKQVYNTSGTVQSSKIKVFYSPVNATIKSNKATVGDVVSKGDKLVVFDVTDLERENRQSELNVLSAQYTNEDAAEQSSRAKQSAAQLEKNTAKSVKSLESKIAKKKNEIKKLEKAAKDSSNLAEKENVQMNELQKKMQKNLDSQTEKKAVKENADRQLENLDKEAADYAQKSQEYIKAAEEATNEISRLETEYRVLEQKKNSIGSTDAPSVSQQLTAAKQELDTLRSSLTELKNSSTQSTAAGLTDAQKKNMDVTENLAELAAKSAKELLEEGREGIKAEFDGVISDVKALEGSEAVLGGELFTLVSNKDVYVELEVPVNDFDNLIEGNQAEIKIGSLDYQGTVTDIDKIALQNEKGNPVIKAKVDIDNPDENIYIGVNAKVDVSVAEKNEALCLPLEVINTSADGDFVYVIKEGKVVRQNVELGVISDSQAEITKGLEEGDEVVSGTGSDITEGMKATAKKE